MAGGSSIFSRPKAHHRHWRVLRRERERELDGDVKGTILPLVTPVERERDAAAVEFLKSLNDGDRDAESPKLSSEQLDTFDTSCAVSRHVRDENSVWRYVTGLLLVGSLAYAGVQVSKEAVRESLPSRGFAPHLHPYAPLTEEALVKSSFAKMRVKILKKGNPRVFEVDDLQELRMYFNQEMGSHVGSVVWAKVNPDIKFYRNPDVMAWVGGDPEPSDSVPVSVDLHTGWGGRKTTVILFDLTPTGVRNVRVEGDDPTLTDGSAVQRVRNALEDIFSLSQERPEGDSTQTPGD